MNSANQLKTEHRNTGEGDPLIVSLTGVLNAETSQTLERRLESIRERSGKQNLVIDFQDRTAVSPDAALWIKRIENDLVASGCWLLLVHPPRIMMRTLRDAGLASIDGLPTGLSEIKGPGRTR